MINNCKIIKVDFKLKKKILEVPNYQVYDWKCFVCTGEYTHDSRIKDNIKHIMIEFDRKKFYICPKCVEHMYFGLKDN